MVGSEYILGKCLSDVDMMDLGEYDKDERDDNWMVSSGIVDAVRG